MTRLGYKTLGRRLRVKDALIATPDAELPTDQIDWSKSDFFLEATAIAGIVSGLVVMGSEPSAGAAGSSAADATDDADVEQAVNGVAFAA